MSGNSGISHPAAEPPGISRAEEATVPPASLPSPPTAAVTFTGCHESLPHCPKLGDASFLAVYFPIDQWLLEGRSGPPPSTPGLLHPLSSDDATPRQVVSRTGCLGPPKSRVEAPAPAGRDGEGIRSRGGHEGSAPRGSRLHRRTEAPRVSSPWEGTARGACRPARARPGLDLPAP